MHIDWLIEIFKAHSSQTAVVWSGRAVTYEALLAAYERSSKELAATGLEPGTVVGLEADFSPNSIAMLLALISRCAIIVPQSNLSRAGRERKDEIGEVELYYLVDAEDNVSRVETGRTASHELYAELRRRGHPGLVLFSSGTSGDPKGAVHDFTHLLEKFAVRRTASTTLNFLLFDHWGGLNTMFHTLANAATVVTLRDRAPDSVASIIERFKVALLPATPTFLNLLLLSGAQKNFDLSSLKIITYGAEPMPQNTLERLKVAFPEVKLQQTYGLIEVGVLRSKSRDDGSLWVKIGGEGYETRVVDGILQIKTKSTILGYLNAQTPVTDDGWFITGDAVLQDGEYFRILGRKSELINVGGEKVYPAEVESVIQSMAGVVEATVYGEKSPLIGNIVCAKVRTAAEVDSQDFARQLKQHCQERLERFKVPVKIQVVQDEQFGDRFKKIRRQAAAAE